MCDNGEIIARSPQYQFQDPAANSPLSCGMKNTSQLAHSSPKNTAKPASSRRSNIHIQQLRYQVRNGAETPVISPCLNADIQRRFPATHHSLRLYTLDILYGCARQQPTRNMKKKKKKEKEIIYKRSPGSAHDGI